MHCKYEIFGKLRESRAQVRNRYYRLVSGRPIAERREAWQEVLTQLRGTGGSGSNADTARSWEQNSSFRALSIVDSDYPESFYHLEQPPLFFFQKPSTVVLPEQQRIVAIVGSRKADQEGVGIARWFAKELSGVGVTVASGLAYGADAAAHWGALAGGGQFPTIAVLGSGVQEIYPRAHEKLAHRILCSGGALLSEYLPNVGPRKHHFLERNRLIAALAHSVVVVQAGKRSGALSTARHALEMGRDVYVVPGSIRNPLYEGSNDLIRQGASPITTPCGLVRELGVGKSIETKSIDPTFDRQRKEILAYLATYGASSLSAIQQNVTEVEVVEKTLEELLLKEEVHKTWTGRFAIG